MKAHHTQVNIKFRGKLKQYIAMLAASDVVKALKKVGINAVHVKLKAKGGAYSKTPGPGA